MLIHDDKINSKELIYGTGATREKTSLSYSCKGTFSWQLGKLITIFVPHITSKIGIFTNFSSYQFIFSREQSTFVISYISLLRHLTEFPPYLFALGASRKRKSHAAKYELIRKLSRVTIRAGHPCLKTRSSGFSVKCALISTLILSWGLGSFPHIGRGSLNLKVVSRIILSILPLSRWSSDYVPLPLCTIDASAPRLPIPRTLGILLLFLIFQGP